MKTLKLQLIFGILLSIGLVACGGGGMKTTPSPSTPGSTIRDPQGNWAFVLTNGSKTLTWGGQLFELSPPVVTSNNSLAFYTIGATTTYLDGSIHVDGTAGDNASITMTAKQVSRTATSPENFALTGIIAPDEKSMSGTFTNSNTLSRLGSSGTWTAQLIGALTGTYTGTLTEVNSGNQITVSLVTTENTDQTTSNMGALTGSIAVSGACTVAQTPLTNSYHVGFDVNVTDANHVFDPLHAEGDGSTVGAVKDGSHITFDQTTDLSTGDHHGNYFTFSNGSCQGQQYRGTLTKQ